MRWVIATARRQAGHCHWLVEDLVTEGVLGFIEALKRFDETRGARVLTYASPWIENRMRTYRNLNANAVSVPIDARLDVVRMQKAITGIRESGEEPTDELIASKMGWRVKRVRSTRMFLLQPSSLNAPAFADEDNSEEAMQSLTDTSQAPLDLYQDESDLSAILGQALTHLNPNQRIVITERFGLDGGGERTLADIGARLNVTGERVRQIENKALKVLKEHGVDLHDFCTA
jgi:RNA polymerase sigma factor (sigma-70 family)